MGALDGRIAAIKELAAMGLSAAQIASRLPGETRSSVLGVCHRHGVQLARSPQQVPRVLRPADGKAADDPGEQDGRPVAPLTKRPAPPPARLEGCRWPLWGDREAPTHEYCGGPIATPGRPYCAEHEVRSRGKGNVERAAEEGLRDPRARRAGAALDGLVDGDAA